MAKSIEGSAEDSQAAFYASIAQLDSIVSEPPVDPAEFERVFTEAQASGSRAFANKLLSIMEWAGELVGVLDRHPDPDEYARGQRGLFAQILDQNQPKAEVKTRSTDLDQTSTGKRKK